jgi:hypothetical protein
MSRPTQSQSLIVKPSVLSAVAIVILLTLAAAAANAQTLTVLHNFGGLALDGANPEAGLTMDAAGNLYGTTTSGGGGYGTVFELKRVISGLIYLPLYNFKGGDDGDTPIAKVTIGPSGSLYGTTIKGGGTQAPFGVGTVFNLQPPATTCKAVLCSWRETVLLAFSGANGSNPVSGVTFAQAGNLFGTTVYGGQDYNGVVYEITPSNGAWTANVIYTFRNSSSEYQPAAGVIFDPAGNLYGTTSFSGIEYGAVYQLVPSGQSWTENTLYDFKGGADGGVPVATLIMDRDNNLYGTTPWFPEGNNPGTVYQLTPSDGTWTYSLLYTFPSGNEGAGAVSTLTMDKDGNLYGEASEEGIVGGTCPYGCGSIFKLTPSSGGWIYTDLYDFTGGADGGGPNGGVVLDDQGTLYGTTYFGGTGPNCQDGGRVGCGTAWKLTP